MCRAWQGFCVAPMLIFLHCAFSNVPPIAAVIEFAMWCAWQCCGRSVFFCCSVVQCVKCAVCSVQCAAWNCCSVPYIADCTVNYSFNLCRAVECNKVQRSSHALCTVVQCSSGLLQCNYSLITWYTLCCIHCTYQTLCIWSVHCSVAVQQWLVQYKCSGGVTVWIL